ncbi:MAG: hypothetical protein K5894_00200 [Lachnospiraceae bacterium]|nr:hypothetical protein [Lachnospiraceae bacterium]MDN4742619.1 hypothetical protein [Lachnospiraceae bacterium C1.1]
MLVSTVISDLVLLIISIGMFCYTLDVLKDNKAKKNAEITLIIGIVLCIAGFWSPEFIFPFHALALIYMIYTDFASAVALLGMFGTITMVSANESSGYFFYFMIPAIILLLPFKNPDKYFNVKKTVLYYTLSSMLIYAALFILYSLKITPENIIFPAIGILMNVLVTIIVMPKIQHGFLFKTEEIYKNIVDPEYHLLLKLRKENNHEYKRAIHSAYLSGRCADRVKADSRLARGCAYYHRIGVLTEGEENLSSKTANLIDENEFPTELADMIKICAGAKKSYLPKEVAIALICDDLISSIIKFMEQKPGESINYDALIDLIFERISNRAPVVDSDLSLRDIRIIKKKLKEEKLYYDFLR